MTSDEQAGHGEAGGHVAGKTRRRLRVPGPGSPRPSSATPPPAVWLPRSITLDVEKLDWPCRPEVPAIPPSSPSSGHRSRGRRRLPLRPHGDAPERAVPLGTGRVSHLCTRMSARRDLWEPGRPRQDRSNGHEAETVCVSHSGGLLTCPAVRPRNTGPLKNDRLPWKQGQVCIC